VLDDRFMVELLTNVQNSVIISSATQDKGLLDIACRHYNEMSW